jgi:hypothetical protein
MAEQQKNIQSGNTAAVGFAGAIIGAGVAVAATRILSDKKSRDKVMDVLTDVKKQVLQSMQTVKITAEDGVNTAQKTIEETIPEKKATSSARTRTRKEKAE